MNETTKDKPAAEAADRLDGVVSTTARLTTEHGSVMISVNKTDMTVNDLFDEVIEPMLLAAGYSKESIESLFEC